LKKNISYIISNIDKAIAFEWIAESIKCVLAEPQLCNQLIKNGKESIAEFELLPFIQKLEDLYQ